MIFVSIDVEATGRNLCGLMREKEYTAWDIANMVGVSAQTVYSWRSGKKIPSIDNLVVLSAILETSLDDLIVIRKDGEIEDRV